MDKYKNLNTKTSRVVSRNAVIQSMVSTARHFHVLIFLSLRWSDMIIGWWSRTEICALISYVHTCTHARLNNHFQVAPKLCKQTKLITLSCFCLVPAVYFLQTSSICTIWSNYIVIFYRSFHVWVFQYAISNHQTPMSAVALSPFQLLAISFK